MSEKPISDLRHRVLEDMAVRKFGDKTRHDYIRHVETFTAFLGRSPDTATADDVRRYQVHLTGTGAPCQVRVPVQAERHHAHLLPTRRRRGERPGRRRHARHRIRPPGPQGAGDHPPLGEPVLQRAAAHHLRRHADRKRARRERPATDGARHRELPRAAGRADRRSGGDLEARCWPTIRSRSRSSGCPTRASRRSSAGR
jgi:Phage integrase, N-terminal SAM-like domain